MSATNSRLAHYIVELANSWLSAAPSAPAAQDAGELVAALEECASTIILADQDGIKTEEIAREIVRRQKVAGDALRAYRSQSPTGEEG